MHIAISVAILLETFGGKLFSGIFCISKNDFFDIFWGDFLFFFYSVLLVIYSTLHLYITLNYLKYALYVKRFAIDITPYIT